VRFKVEKSFDKDVSMIRQENLLQKLRTFISTVEMADNINEIKDIKKIQGYDSFYRKKIGEYRLGIELTTNNEIILLRFLHRKDIYRHFPKSR